nr:MAG TPA: hypothetical protein [Caudoviricetes sp.]
MYTYIITHAYSAGESIHILYMISQVYSNT